MKKHITNVLISGAGGLFTIGVMYIVPKFFTMSHTAIWVICIFAGILVTAGILALIELYQKHQKKAKDHVMMLYNQTYEQARNDFERLNRRIAALEAKAENLS